MPRPLALAACFALLAACGAQRFDTGAVDPDLTPPKVAADPDRARGWKVQWGGLVLHTAVLADATEVEVLAYPLHGSGRPRTDQAPLGRFLARSPGYLDPAEYAQGRLLTVVGPVAGTREGKVGEAAYTYPLVAAEQSHLWAPEPAAGEPRFHFGLGFILR